MSERSIMSNKPAKAKKKQNITKITATSTKTDKTDKTTPVKNQPLKSEKTEQTPEHTAVASVSKDDKNLKVEEKSVKKAKKDKKDKSAKKQKGDKSTEEKPIKEVFILVRPFVAFGRYLRDSWREIRQVRWPNRKATWKMTLAVLVYCAIFGVFILLLDMFFTFLFNLLLGTN